MVVWEGQVEKGTFWSRFIFIGAMYQNHEFAIRSVHFRWCVPLNVNSSRNYNRYRFRIILRSNVFIYLCLFFLIERVVSFRKRSKILSPDS